MRRLRWILIAIPLFILPAATLRADELKDCTKKCAGNRQCEICCGFLYPAPGKTCMEYCYESRNCRQDARKYCADSSDPDKAGCFKRAEKRCCEGWCKRCGAEKKAGKRH